MPEPPLGLSALLEQGEHGLGVSLAKLACGSGTPPETLPPQGPSLAALRLGEALARRPPGAAGLDPLVWLVYYRLGQAILGEAPAPRLWTHDPERLERLAGRCLPDDQVVAWGDPLVYGPLEWQAILALLQEGGDFVADLAPPSAASLPRLQRACAAVQTLVRRLPTGLGPAIAPLLRLTILAVPGPSARAAGQSFGGATAFFLRGASVVHASPGLTLPGLLERLVHEAAHAELFVLAQDTPLCHNADCERHPVRIRPDPRPMNGILHSLHVTGRVCETLDALLSLPQLAADLVNDPQELALLLEDVRRLRAQQAQLGRSSLEAVRRHGRLTGLGEAVVEAGARRLEVSALGAGESRGAGSTRP